MYINLSCVNTIVKLFKELIKLDIISLVLVIIGALNWGSIGLFGVDVVATIFGGQLALVSRIIFGLVGLAGIWCITLLFRDRGNKDTISHT
ncbi:MAG: DUF378 domain-containing protein [Clostridia bacterium]|nr:DUF378 domain-containing protein [Clostridia bacterium]